MTTTLCTIKNDTHEFYNYYVYTYFFSNNTYGRVIDKRILRTATTVTGTWPSDAEETKSERWNITLCTR